MNVLQPEYINIPSCPCPLPTLFFSPYASQASIPKVPLEQYLSRRAAAAVKRLLGLRRHPALRHSPQQPNVRPDNATQIPAIPSPKVSPSLGLGLAAFCARSVLDDVHQRLGTAFLLASDADLDLDLVDLDISRCHAQRSAPSSSPIGSGFLGLSSCDALIDRRLFELCCPALEEDRRALERAAIAVRKQRAAAAGATPGGGGTTADSPGKAPALAAPPRKLNVKPLGHAHGGGAGSPSPFQSSSSSAPVDAQLADLPESLREMISGRPSSAIASSLAVAGLGSSVTGGDDSGNHIIRSRLQQAFLSQYSTNEAPVKMREVAGYVAENLTVNTVTAAIASSVSPLVASACARLPQEVARRLQQQQQQLSSNPRDSEQTASGRDARGGGSGSDIETALHPPQTGNNLPPLTPPLGNISPDVLLDAARLAVPQVAEALVRETVTSALDTGARACLQYVAERVHQVGRYSWGSVGSLHRNSGYLDPVLALLGSTLSEMNEQTMSQLSRPLVPVLLVRRCPRFSRRRSPRRPGAPRRPWSRRWPCQGARPGCLSW